MVAVEHSAKGQEPTPVRTVATLLTAVEDLLGHIRQQLAAPAAAPGLHLSPVEVDALAARLGIASQVTPGALLTSIDRLASMRIGDIRIPFTPGQLAELQHRAGKRGRTVEAEMRAVVARIEEELFYKGS